MKHTKRKAPGDPVVSRPARGAWIETAAFCAAWAEASVAPRAGRVD